MPLSDAAAGSGRRALECVLATPNRETCETALEAEQPHPVRLRRRRATLRHGVGRHGGDAHRRRGVGGDRDVVVGAARGPVDGPVRRDAAEVALERGRGGVDAGEAPLGPQLEALPADGARRAPDAAQPADEPEPDAAEAAVELARRAAGPVRAAPGRNGSWRTIISHDELPWSERKPPTHDRSGGAGHSTMRHSHNN